MTKPEVTKEKMEKWLITAMSHMKTIYEDNGIPWSLEDEVMFQAIYNLIEEHKPRVDKEALIEVMQKQYENYPLRFRFTETIEQTWKTLTLLGLTKIQDICDFDLGKEPK